MELFEILNQNISYYVKKQKYRSFELFCHECNIYKGTLWRLMHGKAKPKVETLLKIANALEVTLNDLAYQKKKSRK